MPSALRRTIALGISCAALCAPDALPAADAPAPAESAAADSTEIASLRAKAERGNAIAQYNLGLAYAQGRGTRADPIEALVWLTLASDGGSTGRALTQVRDAMTAAQIAEANGRVEALRRANPAWRTANAARSAPAATVPAAANRPTGGAASATPAPGTRATTEEPDTAALRTQLAEAQAALSEQAKEAAAARAQAAAVRIELGRLRAQQDQERANAPGANGANELAELREKLATARQQEGKQAALAVDLTAARSELDALRQEREGLKVNEANAQAALTVLRAEKEALTAELNEAVATARRAGAGQASAPSSGELEALRRERDALKVAQTESAAALANASAARDALTAQLAAAGDAGREVATQRAQIARLAEELATARRAAEAAEAAATQATAEKGRAQAELAAQARARAAGGEAQAAEVAQLRAALATAEKQAAERAANVTELQQQVQTLEAARQSAAAERKRLADALAFAEAARDEALKRVEAARKSQAAPTASPELAAANQALAETREKLSAAQRESATLREQATAATAQLETRVRTLESEKAALAAAPKNTGPSREEFERMVAARDESEQKLATALRSHALVTQERDALSAELATAKVAALPRPSPELAAANFALAEAREKLTAAQRESATLREQATAAAAQFDARVRALESEKASLADAPKSVGPSREEFERVTAARAESEQKLATALRSYSLLAQERDALSAQLAARPAVTAPSPAPAAAPAQDPALQKELVELRQKQAVADVTAATAQAEIGRLNAALAAANRAASLREPQRPTALALARPAPATPPVAPALASVAAAPASRPSTSVTSVATPPTPTPAPRMHTVMSGETLSGIARQYYGNASRWPEILAANRDVIRNERALIVGRTLRIP